MAELNRRDFIVAATAATFGACAGCPLHDAAMAAPAKKKDPVDVGVVADFPRDGVYDRWAKERSFFVVRKSGRLYAVSATCTHKRFALVLDDGDMKCPKHGSIFSIAGKPTKAPAKKPLPRFGIGLDARRHVIVDPAREYAEKQWNDPGSYVSV